MKIKLIILSILAFTFIFANYKFNNNEKKAPLIINKIFPNKIEEWEGKDLKVDKYVFDMLNPDNLLMRLYKNIKTGQETSLAIVLTNERSQIHDPEVCYRFQNIEMDKEEDIVLYKNYMVKHVFGSSKKELYDIIYWYTDLNKNYTNRAKFMREIAISKFLDKYNDSFALVVIISPKTQNTGIYKFAEHVNKFMIDAGTNY